ncbi:biotin/lipoyl-containing protein [Halorarum halobium]|uniref:biotin/lipoyl-containing protein n=1 Tax=Halorarum halobium TaxID=3075121 RepID=UPI0028A74D48|nr:biotin/lipoyl-containing protein [Halobaculum sp. XH14]
MGEIIHVPDDGPDGRTHGSIRWHADAGASVRKGDLIAEIDYRSGTATVVAAERGVLHETLVADGQDVVPGGPIGVIVESPEEFLGLPWGVASEVEASDLAEETDRETQDGNTA